MLTEEALRCAVETAVLAPSLHNSQPWLFRRDGDRIVVRADPSRWLRDTDPQGRELMISCGGAVRHLVLGLRTQGLEVDWKLVPDEEDALLVAHVTVTGVRPPSLIDLELLAAARSRHTDRSAFTSDRVNPNVVDRLRRIAELEDCFLDELDRDDEISLAVLTELADRTLTQDPNLRAESSRWSRATPSPRDGVSADALPQQGAHRGSPVPLRRFGEGEPQRVPGEDPPAAEHPTLMVLGTDCDTRHDWVACGWTLSDLLLTMTCEGVVASPITQPLELPVYRQRLATALSLQGHPQMVLRIGYPAGAGSPRAGRRPAVEVLA